MTPTLKDRRERGETIVKRDGAEVVHGKVLARETLADYDALVEEHNRIYRTVSPYRSDYAEITAAIDADLLEMAYALAYAVQNWLEDDEWTAAQRDAAISRIAWTS